MSLLTVNCQLTTVNQLPDEYHCYPGAGIGHL
jgi:hypothetical protein